DSLFRCRHDVHGRGHGYRADLHRPGTDGDIHLRIGRFFTQGQAFQRSCIEVPASGRVSSGIFAYGLSLFYGLIGSTNLLVIAKSLAEHPGKPGAITVIALLTTATGLLFKIAAIPFHQWAPDAYEGAPTSVTGFMSVAVKAAAWAMLLRIFLWGLYP